MSLIQAAALLGALFIGENIAMAQPKGPSEGLVNLKLPTLGGVQFWTDAVWRSGWRIQHNAVTGHYRLLNPSNIRHAWGSKTACENALNRLQPSRALEAKRVVILIHGLGRSAGSMRGLGRVLDKQPDCHVVYFEYASTRASISEHAASLAGVVAGLPADSELCFVGHSMGNIIVRHLIHDFQQRDDQQTLKRIKSMVMLGPPNQGAAIARQLAKTGVFGLITGDGGMELGPKWEELSDKLATPHCPFGIIAGRLPKFSVPNPLVGEGDFVVGVEETRLDGARAELEVPRMHSFLMDDPAVQKAVVAFLDHQSFE